MQEKRIETFANVDMRAFRLPIVAVYKNPEDFPGRCAARIYDIDKPTDTVMVKKTLTEIEIDIRKNLRLTFMPRGAGDVTSLVGTWI